MALGEGTLIILNADPKRRMTIDRRAGMKVADAIANTVQAGNAGRELPGFEMFVQYGVDSLVERDATLVCACNLNRLARFAHGPA